MLLVQQEGVQLKHLKRRDVDATHISIGVQTGPLHGPLATTTRHLLCMRHVLLVRLTAACFMDAHRFCWLSVLVTVAFTWHVVWH